MVENDIEIPDKYFGFIQHYYRAEIYRETNWRNRLDVTTNWSIVVTAAMLSFTFSNESVPHTVILVNFLIVLFFLYTESRRFRYYSRLKKRTRLIEQHLLSPLFKNPGKAMRVGDWGKDFYNHFVENTVPMSRMESIGWRMRRNYMFILPAIFLAWVTKVSFEPERAQTIKDFFANAHLWSIPGEFVFGAFISFVTYLLVIAFYFPRASHEDDMP